MNDIISIIDRIVAGETVPAADLIPFLSSPRVEERVEANVRLASAYFLLDTEPALVMAKECISRAWLQSGYAAEIVDQFVKIHTAAGDIEAVKEAFKRIGMVQAEKGNGSEALHYFDYWQYAHAIFRKQDVYRFDADVMNAIGRIASRFIITAAPEPWEAARPIRLAYLLKGITELNSVLIKINKQFAKYHDKSRFDVRFFVTETEEQILQSKQGSVHVQEFADFGWTIVPAPGLENRIERNVAVARMIAEFRPDTIVASAVLANLDHYFVTKVLSGFPAIVFNQGPPAQYTPPDAAWSIAWTRHPQMDCPVGCTLVPFEDDLFDPAAVTAADRAVYGIPAEAKLIISAGRLPKFQSPLFWQAVDRVLTEVPDSHFLAIGIDETSRAMVTGMVSGENGARITLLGWCEEYLPVLRMADVVFDTYPNGGGYTVVDAMVMGIPVVAFRNNYLTTYDQTNWSPAEEIIRIDELLVARGDVDGFTVLMKELLNDEALRTALGESCRDMIRATRGNPLRMVQRCEQVYEQVIRGTIGTFTDDFAAGDERTEETMEHGGQAQVSVIVPVTGTSAALDAALNSILTQTYTKWEAIIVGTPESDLEEEIVEKYVFADRRFRHLVIPSRTITELLQAGLESAIAPWFAWLPAGATYRPEKLAQQVAQIEGKDDTDFCWGELENARPRPLKNEEVTDPSQPRAEFIRCLGVTDYDSTTVLARVSAMKKAGGFSGEWYILRESELWLRMAALGAKSVTVPAPIVRKETAPSTDRDREFFMTMVERQWFLDKALRSVNFSAVFPPAAWSTDVAVQNSLRTLFAVMLDVESQVNSTLLKDRFHHWLQDGLKALPIDARKRVIAYGKDVFTQMRRTSRVFEMHLQFFQELESTIGRVRPVAQEPAVVTDPKVQFTRMDEQPFLELLRRQTGKFHKAMQFTEAQNLTEYIVLNTGHLEPELLDKFTRSVMVNSNFNGCLRVFAGLSDWEAQARDTVKATYLFSRIAAGQFSAQEESLLNTLQSDILRRSLSQRGDVRELSVGALRQWNFDGDVDANAVRHLVQVQCEECGTLFESAWRSPLGPSPVSATVVCHSCFAQRTISDRMMRPFFMKRNERISPRRRKENAMPDVALALRYTGSIGGGVNNMFRYAEWLQELGCAVTIYSTEPNAPNRSFTGKFVQVKDHYDLPAEHHDLILCMCAMDIPKLTTRSALENIALVCQGYEGYHYGNDVESLRSDKYFFDELHAFPVKKIVVSTHLRDLFLEKFGQKALYVPNGIDHSVFFPDVTVQRTSPSILFVGNPLQKLKGADFLTQTLMGLQKSSVAIPGLTVHVAMGGAGDTMEQRQDLDGFTALYHVGLDTKGMAALVNSVDVVVNTSWYEGFSLPVLEAMACGTPVITTDNKGAESFTYHGVNGFVVPYGDHLALTKELLGIFRKSVDMAPLIASGLRTAEEYSMENTVRSFHAELSQYLGVTFPEKKSRALLEKYAGTVQKKQSDRPQRSERPLFSILVPTYNQDQFVPMTLDSIRAQTEEDWEAVVVNDGSTDNTRAVIEKYAMIDDRIRVFHKPNGGVASALNEALRNAQGEWILWLSSDDLFEPTKLEIHKREFAARPEGKFFYTNYSLLYHQTQQKVPGYPGIAPREDQVLSFFYTNFVNGISICIHRSVFEQVGFFNEQLRDAQDFDMWIRIAAETGFEFIDEKTCTYRVHPDQGASKFPEAGLWDSALSCAMFLNRNTFDRIFPLLDVTDRESIELAIKKTFSIVVDPKSFVNKLGFGRLLIDRMHEWISNVCPAEFRSELNPKVKAYVVAILQKEPTHDARESIAALITAGEDDFLYTPCDVFGSAKQFIEKRKRFVAEKEAALYDKYLKRFEKVFAVREEVNTSLMAAMQALGEKQFQSALDVLTPVLERVPEDFREEASIVRGYAHLGLQQMDEAKACFEDALAANPNSSDACAGLGEVFFLAEMDDQAKTMFEWAVRNDRGSAKAVAGLQKVNEALGLPADHNTLFMEQEEAVL